MFTFSSPLLNEAGAKQKKKVTVVDSSHVPTYSHQIHGYYLALSACCRSDGNLVCTCWKLCIWFCVITAFSSCQIFKPHLKPYTGRTVQRRDLCERTSIGLWLFLCYKKGWKCLKWRGQCQSNCGLPWFILCNNFNSVFFQMLTFYLWESTADVQPVMINSLFFFFILFDIFATVKYHTA